MCMPITCKRHEEGSDEEHTFTSFVYKARWFVLSQTDGQEFEPVTVPEWDAERAISALSIERIPFDHTDGNVQGFARQRQVAKEAGSAKACVAAATHKRCSSGLDPVGRRVMVNGYPF